MIQVPDLDEDRIDHVLCHISRRPRWCRSSELSRNATLSGLGVDQLFLAEIGKEVRTGWDPDQSVCVRAVHSTAQAPCFGCRRGCCGIGLIS